MSSEFWEVPILLELGCIPWQTSTQYSVHAAFVDLHSVVYAQIPVLNTSGYGDQPVTTNFRRCTPYRVHKIPTSSLGTGKISGPSFHCALALRYPSYSGEYMIHVQFVNRRRSMHR